jgi:hypothetical protein
VQTFNVTGSFAAPQYDVEFDRTFLAQGMAESWTLTDTVSPSSDRTYRLEVVSRVDGTVPGSTIGVDTRTQRYGVISVEG